LYAGIERLIDKGLHDLEAVGYAQGSQKIDTLDGSNQSKKVWPGWGWREAMRVRTLRVASCAAMRLPVFPVPPVSRMDSNI
jgi:acyl CoA:acetate/3-ketoacid CoA transferase alpha subunit